MTKSTRILKGFIIFYGLLITGIFATIVFAVYKNITSNFFYKKTHIIISSQYQKPQTELRLSIPIPVDSLSSSYKTNIDITTNNNSVSLVQLELSYNPNILNNINIAAGNFIKKPNVIIKNIDPSNGRISFVISINRNSKPVSGKGIIAQLTYNLNTQNPTTVTSIGFLPKTQVLNQENNYVLENSSIRSYSLTF